MMAGAYAASPTFSALSFSTSLWNYMLCMAVFPSFKVMRPWHISVKLYRLPVAA